MRGHRGSVISMDRRLIGIDSLSCDRLIHELFGLLAALMILDSSTNDRSRVDVQDHIELVADPLVGPLSLLMSQLHTCPGSVATSSGLTFAGWVA
jgi:hypothetical protein